MRKVSEELIKALLWETKGMNEEEFQLYLKNWSDSARQAAIAARRAKGAKARSEDFNKVYGGGEFNKEAYAALPAHRKTGVLREATKAFESAYVPKDRWASETQKFDSEISKKGWLDMNKSIGQYEGMRRASIQKADSAKGKEQRKWLQMAIVFQGKAAETAAERAKLKSVKSEQTKSMKDVLREKFLSPYRELTDEAFEELTKAWSPEARAAAAAARKLRGSIAHDTEEYAGMIKDIESLGRDLKQSGIVDFSVSPRVISGKEFVGFRPKKEGSVAGGGGEIFQTRGNE